MRVAAVAVVVGMLCPSAVLAAPQQRASLPDIEDEVMCTICGTLLELSQAPQADRERALINRLIARGETKQQIKDELVAEYGPNVLAVPESKGFDLAAFVVPVIALLAALAGLAFGAMRWRARRDKQGEEPAPPSPGREDGERLDADIARYDL